MTWTRNPSFRILIAALLLSSLACQAVSRVFDKPDMEATIEAGMAATRKAEATEHIPETHTQTPTIIPTIPEVPSETPSPLPSATPSITASTTPSITLSITPSPDPIRELLFNHLNGLGLFFDATQWMATEDDIGRAVLESLQISGCTIQEQGPTEPPPINRQIQIGAITYDVAEFEANTDQGDLFVSWFLARDGFINPLAGTIPVLIVITPLEDTEACLSRADDVLKTLHPISQ